MDRHVGFASPNACAKEAVSGRSGLCWMSLLSVHGRTTPQLHTAINTENRKSRTLIILKAFKVRSQLLEVIYGHLAEGFRAVATGDKDIPQNHGTECR